MDPAVGRDGDADRADTLELSNLEHLREALAPFVPPDRLEEAAWAAFETACSLSGSFAWISARRRLARRGPGVPPHDEE